MLCPNCRLTMRVTESAGGKTKEYYCGGCGHKKTERLAGSKSPKLAPVALRSIEEIEDRVSEDPPIEEEVQEEEEVEFSSEKELEPDEKKDEVFEEKTEVFDDEKVKKIRAEAEKKKKLKEAKKAKSKPKDPPEKTGRDDKDEEDEEDTKKENTTFTRKLRQAEAKKITHIKQLSRDLKSRVNDLQIQLDRRVDEIVEMAEKLNKKIEEDI